MLTLRHSPFDLLERLEQQVNQAERVPAAEVHETDQAYVVVLELPGVDKESIEVKATDRSLLISAERRSLASSAPSDAKNGDARVDGPIHSEFRYGTWSRSFRFAGGLQREGIEARYRDGLLTVTAPKAQTHSTVVVKVEG
ncbi:Hsp20/alpha crystallin family protein [Synechococcus sp. RedBA-s]|uniref:Hsp20/alpha crystallin family protein n=1 Tax=Synechococcus sp. RedBA-s TaxID=2823741 RepID=UPI0020CF6F59|nr:Hsp20/alpha crystallin family protein [Synechococcus sp. RedBA-s]MCP9799777.1 Hsp20/alpha crystallin family protein [Synechococcus sp. RedBA-s]